MNERLIVKSFGPVKELDIVFKSITILIGDQGTGKSCIAKLFSMFKWLEKELVMQRQKSSYYESYNRFSSMLCKYHRLESFIKEDTYIKYEGEKYSFEYDNSKFHIFDNGGDIMLLPKIIYIPAERAILSVAENKSRLLKELPASCDTFQDVFSDAKKNFKRGYNLPFGELHYEYDSLNDTSRISGKGYEENPVKLTHASSGIQSALPLCLVSEYLSGKILEKEETKLSKEEKSKMERQISEIMDNDAYTESVKEIMLKKISSLNRYGCFVNITEEPELNLFPKSQMGVIQSLVKNNNSSQGNKLVITTHSPYTLAILNLLIIAAKTYNKGDEETKKEVESILPVQYHIGKDHLAAYSLNEGDDETPYCKSIISENTGMIAKNDLDSISETISMEFNKLYRLYAKSDKQ